MTPPRGWDRRRWSWRRRRGRSYHEPGGRRGERLRSDTLWRRSAWRPGRAGNRTGRSSRSSAISPTVPGGPGRKKTTLKLWTCVYSTNLQGQSIYWGKVSSRPRLSWRKKWLCLSSVLTSLKRGIVKRQKTHGNLTLFSVTSRVLTSLSRAAQSSSS